MLAIVVDDDGEVVRIAGSDLRTVIDSGRITGNSEAIRGAK